MAGWRIAVEPIKLGVLMDWRHADSDGAMISRRSSWSSRRDSSRG